MTTLYAPAASKRQKTTRETAKCVVEQNEFFPGLGVVEYRPDAGIEETLCYRHYNSGERVHGRTMEDWMRPAVSFRHAFPHAHRHRDRSVDGDTSTTYPGDDHATTTTTTTTTVDGHKRRIRAAFELLAKLGVKYWTLHDGDVACEGDAWDETCRHQEEVVELIAELQTRGGVRPLWVAADLHSHPRYANGSATSPDASIACHAGAQLKKCLDAALKLGAECFLYRGGRERYGSVLTADLPREVHNYARQLRMVAGYRERIGYRGQLLFQAKREQAGRDVNTEASSCYDSDALSAMYLLRHNSLERNFKLSVAPGHQLFMASAYGMLGSIDATKLKSPPNINDTTLLMKTVIEQGGMQPGGLNIGINLQRQSADVKELMIAYVACIDTFARGLRNAAKMVADGVFAKNLQQRYLSFHTGFGSRLANGEASLEDCEDHARKQRAELVASSGRPQHWVAVFNHYV